MLDMEYIKTLVKKAAEFGNGKIHIIVNNAGSVLLRDPALTYADKVLVDILGTVLFTRCDFLYDVPNWNALQIERQLGNGKRNMLIRLHTHR
jgi:hypothetical protein